MQVVNLLAVINLHSVGKFTRSDMLVSYKAVTPAKAGVQRVCNLMNRLDSGVRRNDGEKVFPDFLRVPQSPSLSTKPI